MGEQDTSATPKNPVHVLSESESLLRLGSQKLGRLVTRIGETIDIFPINFALDHRDIVIRTAPGSKLAEVVLGGEVLFEADYYDDVEAWSVVVRGSARLLHKGEELAHAETLPLRPMVPTVKRVFVRITPHSISGRAFELGPEPPRN